MKELRRLRGRDATKAGDELEGAVLPSLHIALAAPRLPYSSWLRCVANH